MASSSTTVLLGAKASSSSAQGPEIFVWQAEDGTWFQFEDAEQAKIKEAMDSGAKFLDLPMGGETFHIDLVDGWMAPKANMEKKALIMKKRPLSESSEDLTAEEQPPGKILKHGSNLAMKIQKLADASEQKIRQKGESARATSVTQEDLPPMSSSKLAMAKGVKVTSKVGATVTGVAAGVLVGTANAVGKAVAPKMNPNGNPAQAVQAFYLVSEAGSSAVKQVGSAAVEERQSYVDHVKGSSSDHAEYNSHMADAAKNVMKMGLAVNKLMHPVSGFVKGVGKGAIKEAGGANASSSKR